jgi:hypothetical protein
MFMPTVFPSIMNTRHGITVMPKKIRYGDGTCSLIGNTEYTMLAFPTKSSATVGTIQELSGSILLSKIV